MRISICFDHINMFMDKQVPASAAQAIYDSIECVGQIRSVDLIADDDVTVVAHKSRYDDAHNPDPETIPASPVPSPWYPIETAPQNGGRFIMLAWDAKRLRWVADTNAYWCTGMKTPCFIYDGWTTRVPMFWSPLPDRHTKVPS